MRQVQVDVDNTSRTGRSTKTVEYCAQHAPEGMVDVCSKKCRTKGCAKGPSYGVAGTKTVEY